MKIDKISGQYDAYKMELSYGQLEAIRDSLSQHEGHVIADELTHAIQWYLDKLPRPGEDEKSKDNEEGSVMNSHEPRGGGDIDLSAPPEDEAEGEDLGSHPEEGGEKEGGEGLNDLDELPSRKRFSGKKSQEPDELEEPPADEE